MSEEHKKEDSVNKIKESLENLLNSKTSLKLKRTTKEDKEFEIFEKIINSLEELDVRAFILEKDLDINLTNYDKKFYNVIDNLIELKYGSAISEIIYFYLYERHDKENGNFGILDDVTKKFIPLNNVMDLWNLIQIIKEKVKSKK